MNGAVGAILVTVEESTVGGKGKTRTVRRMEREVSEFGRNGMAVEKVAKDGTSNERGGGGRRRSAEGEKVALQGARGGKRGRGDVRRAGNNRR